MNVKTTIVLLLLAIAGATAYFLAPAPSETTVKPEEPASKQQPLFDPRPDEKTIVRAVVERKGKPRLVFERKPKEAAPATAAPDAPGDWGMVEPTPSAVESYLVSGLVSGAFVANSQGTITPGTKGGVSLADAGLEPPEASLALTDAAGKTYKLAIGVQAPMSRNWYARIDDAKEIHLTDRDWSYDLKREANDYRSKTPIRLQRNNAKQVKIAYEGKTFQLTKGSGEDWVMNSPVSAYANADRVKAIVNALGAVRLDKFVDEKSAAAATAGFEKPYLTVEVVTEERRVVPETQPATQTSQPAEPKLETITNTYSLIVGGAADVGGGFRFVKLADQPWIATLAKESVEQLTPKDLRDPRVTRIQSELATELEITTPAGSARLIRQGEQWQGEGDLSNIDREAVNSLLQAFEDLRAISFEDKPEPPAKFGLDSPPRATIRVVSAGLVEPVTLKVLKDTESGLNSYVQLDGQPSVFVVSAEAAKRLAVDPLALRSRVVFDIRPEQIRKVEVTQGGVTEAIVRTGMEWNLLAPAGAAADPVATREITTDLAMMRAKRVVAKGEDAKYGLDQPLATIRFSVERPAASQPAASQPETAEGVEPGAPTTAPAPPPPTPLPTSQDHTLIIGRTAAGAFARKDNEPYIFELDETVVRSLTAELIRRQLFDFTGDQIESIRVESNNGMVEFKRADKEWTYVPDPTVKLVAKKVSDFANEIAAFRAERYLAYSDADLAAAGLENTVLTASVRLKDGRTVTLKIDQTQSGELPRKAGWVEMKRVLLMRPGDVDKLIRGLDYYVKPEAPAPQPGGGAPQIPGG
ncbi:MAG: hypothetical protein AMXMBFR47_10220 [Planctomycetota bacterium]